MKTISVNTSSKSYEINIGRGLLKNCGDLIKNTLESNRIFIVTDDNVAPLYLDTVKKSLEDSGITSKHLILENGETNKNINSIMKIYESMQDAKISRKDTVIALGGGVIGDMTGFAASTYLRGIKYIQIPTTLLAQVDSSIGGKTGFDLPCGKNLVGSFYQPTKVIIDIDVLKSLPQEQISSGMAEVIKSAFIRSSEFVDLLLNSNNFDKDVEEFVVRSINIKKNVVEKDEFESYERMVLNFGHTLGHALEKIKNYSGITHGQAVAIGMTLITKNDKVKEKLLLLLNKYGLKADCDITINDLIEASKNDKKSVGNFVNIIVVNKIGDAEIKKITFEEFHSRYE